MNWLLTRIAAAVDDAIDAVIGAVIDVVCGKWEEEESSPGPLCGNPTNGGVQ